MKKGKKAVTLLLTVMMLIGTMASSVYAAGYGSISTKTLGYGVSVSKSSDQSITTRTVSQLTNTSSSSAKTSDKVTFSQSITFSSETTSAIKGAISVSSGAVSGSLGTQIAKKYSFTSNYKRTYTKTITKTVPAHTTYTVKANIKGDKVTIYYKYFVLGQCTSKGCGKVYVPKYVNWICE